MKKDRRAEKGWDLCVEIGMQQPMEQKEKEWKADNEGQEKSEKPNKKKKVEWGESSREEQREK